MRRYNERLIWLNVYFLLTIMLMPFMAALCSSYTFSRAAFLVFCLSIVTAGLLQLVLRRYLCDPRQGLVRVRDVRHPDLHPITPLVPVVGFTLAAGLGFLMPGISYVYLPVLMLPLPLLRNCYHCRLTERHQRSLAVAGH